MKALNSKNCPGLANFLNLDEIYLVQKSVAKSYRFFLLIGWLGFCSSHAGSAQVDSVSEAWVARYSGSNTNDFATDMEIDAEGNIYVTGRSLEFGKGRNMVTMKYNTEGKQLWVSVLQIGSRNEVPVSMALDTEGNVYVTGSTGRGGSDFATVKYNTLGEEQWVTRYNGPGNSSDIPYAITVDMEGNVYVTGLTVPSEVSNVYDFATVKYNDSGVEQWSVIYNGPSTSYSYDVPYSIDTDNDGNVYVTGTSYGGETDNDYATIKYDSSGEQQWVARYNGYGRSSDAPTSVLVDQEGNIIVTGYAGNENNNTDYTTIKYNTLGQELWVEKYNGPDDSFDRALAMALDEAGNVFVTGGASGVNTGEDYATIKYNALGEEQWVAVYNGPINHIDRAHAIALDKGGNVYVTGESFGNEGQTDYVTIKYDQSGEQRWLTRYNGIANGHDQGNSIVVDEIGNVFVAGGSEGLVSEYDYVTIKYSQVTTPDSISIVKVKGAGWFYSPSGSIVSYPNAEGKVNFGISASIKNHTSKPEGKMVFNSNSGNLEFKSSTYDSMTVNDQSAVLKGSGTLNDQRNLTFQLSVTDAGETKDQDFIRLLIWDSLGVVVYDNQMGAPVNADPISPLGGGFIKIRHLEEPIDSLSKNLQTVQMAASPAIFKAYPVPFKGEGLWIQFPVQDREGIFEVFITDLWGRKLAEKELFIGKDTKNQWWEVNHHNWQSGIYLLQVQGEGMVYKQRLKK